MDRTDVATYLMGSGIELQAHIIESVAQDLGNERRRLKEAQQKNLERSASLLLNAKNQGLQITKMAPLLRISRQTAYRLMEDSGRES